MLLTINGKQTETDCNTLHALCQSIYGDCDHIVKIVDGYQTEENPPLSSGQSIVLIEKGKQPPEDIFEELLTARLTPGVYQKVKSAKVGIAGLGGLGSAIALSLARTGIGQLHLVDFDLVEPSNLNRQQYRLCHLGMTKTEALRQEIAEINPYVSVKTDQVRVTEENAAALFEQDDIVCEAFDRPEAKAMLVNTLLQKRPERPIVAASGMAGHGSSNKIQTRKTIGSLYLCGDGETESCIGTGLMAPRVQICAGHQANLILQLILGQAEI